MDGAARLVVTLFFGLGLCCSSVGATDLTSDNFFFEEIRRVHAQREARRDQRALWRAREVPFTFGQTMQGVQADLQAIVGGIDFTMPLPEQLRVLFGDEGFRNFCAHEEQADHYELALLQLFFEHRMADFFQVRRHIVQQERYACHFPNQVLDDTFAPHAYVPANKSLYVRRFQDDQFYSYNLAELNSDNPNMLFSRVDDQVILEHLSHNTLPGMQIAYRKRDLLTFPEFNVAVEARYNQTPGVLAPGLGRFFDVQNNRQLSVFNTVPFLYVFAAAGSDHEENDQFLLFDGTSLYVLWGFAQMLHNMSLLDVIVSTAFVHYCRGRNSVQLDRSYEPFLDHVDPRVLEQIAVHLIDE